MSNTKQKPEMTQNDMLNKWSYMKYDHGQLMFSDEHKDEFLADLRSMIQGETSELLKQRDELLADIDFLAKRQQKASSISFYGERDTGVSSNSIVSIAYGLVRLEDQSFPSDLSDMVACENMWKKLPAHRKMGDGLIAMERARRCDYYGKKITKAEER